MTTVQRSATALATPLGLLLAQLQGVELWWAARRATSAALTDARSREGRLDASRRLDVRRREHAAILARLEESERSEPDQLPSRVPVRAVVAHRQQWTRDRLAADLRAHDVDVLLACDNGADVLGTCVVEQPTLLVVDELLAMRSGPEVVQEVRQFCPHTVVVGHVTEERGVGRLLEAGAVAVFTARVRPDQIAEEVVGLL